MPNRIIKESICVSDQINTLSPFEEVLFYRLIVSADDYGRYDGRIAIIKNRLFPLKDSLRVDQIEKALHTLSSQELVERYTVDGRPFVRLTGWDKHQTIRAKKSKYPAPDGKSESLQASENICKQMHANVPVIQSVSESESISESESYSGEGAKAPSARTRGKFSPPTVDEVKAYASDKGLTLDADRFVDFYAAKGWKVGNTPMKDWRAAARNWARDDHRREPPAFRPPKNGEVMSYAAEHGWRGFDYNAFVEHYAARGWCINGTQITDWHPLAQSWWRKNNMEDLPY